MATETATETKVVSPGQEEIVCGDFCISGGTEEGKRRENEDNYEIARNEALGETLLVLCDGMGGHADGSQASQLAVETIRQTYFEARLQGQETQPALEAAFLAANRAIIKLHQAGREPGSCAVAAVLKDDGHYVVANVGDSRAYRIGPNQAQQITKDHSLVAELVDQGTITSKQVYTHENRNVITRVLGSQSAQPDFFESTLGKNEQLMLCSDGLWEMTRDPDGETIRQITKSKNPKAAVKDLIKAALDGGGEDNITVIVANRREPKPVSLPETPSSPTAQPSAPDQARESEARRNFIGKAKTFFKNWWKNVSPQGRDKWRWVFGLAVGAAEQLILRPLLFPILGPAGGWLISGLNALAIQGINQRIQGGVTEAKANGQAGTVANLEKKHQEFADVVAGIAAGSLGSLIGSAIWQGFVSPELPSVSPESMPPPPAVVPGSTEAAAPPIEGITSPVPPPVEKIIEYTVKPGDTLTEILQGMGKDPYGPALTRVITENADLLSAKGPEYASAVREVLAHPDWAARGGSNEIWKTIMTAARLIHPDDILKI